jgi:hypothetical protein
MNSSKKVSTPNSHKKIFKGWDTVHGSFLYSDIRDAFETTPALKGKKLSKSLKKPKNTEWLDSNLKTEERSLVYSTLLPEVKYEGKRVFQKKSSFFKITVEKKRDKMQNVFQKFCSAMVVNKSAHLSACTLILLKIQDFFQLFQKGNIKQHLNKENCKKG